MSQDGWWKSGDSAEIILEGNAKQLKILGRLDTAIHSGGETVFPEHLQQQLLDDANKAGIQIESILLTSIMSEEWGERLVALVRFNDNCNIQESIKIISQLKELVNNWQPSQKPIAWYHCPALKTNSNGKWEHKKWSSWINSTSPIS